jgi:hypothetical protein
MPASRYRTLVDRLGVWRRVFHENIVVPGPALYASARMVALPLRFSRNEHSARSAEYTTTPASQGRLADRFLSTHLRYHFGQWDKRH